jgi:hypothetical protein
VKRTALKSGGYRFNHQARHAVRLTDSYGRPLPKAA